MIARGKLNQLKEKFGPAIVRADLPSDSRLFVFIQPSAVKPVCQHIFRDLDARYVISIGIDDRPYSGNFLVAHNFAFDSEHLLCSVLAAVPPGESADRQHLGCGSGGELGRTRIPRPGGN